MGWRYRKRIKILPGIHINISKSGISTNVGVKGASVTFGPNGTHVNTGFPGTGLYRRDRISGSNHPDYSENRKWYEDTESNSSEENVPKNDFYVVKENGITEIPTFKSQYYIAFIIALLMPFIGLTLYGFGEWWMFFSCLLVDVVQLLCWSFVIDLNNYHDKHATYKVLRIKNDPVLLKKEILGHTVRCIFSCVLILTNLFPLFAMSKSFISLYDNVFYSKIGLYYFRQTPYDGGFIVFLMMTFMVLIWGGCSYNEVNIIKRLRNLLREYSHYNSKGASTNINEEGQMTKHEPESVSINKNETKSESNFERPLTRDIILGNLVNKEQGTPISSLSSQELSAILTKSTTPDSKLSSSTISRQEVRDILGNLVKNSSDTELKQTKESLSRPQDDVIVPHDPKRDLESYHYPTLDLLKKYKDDSLPFIDMEEQNANKNRIVDTLRNFGIEISSIKATVGARITLYEISLAPGVNASKLRGLEDDIALALSSHNVHFIIPIPGKGTIGIEVPNIRPSIVSLESILNTKQFQETTMELPCAIGKIITNEVFMFDLTKAPHILIAGSTGQGKSVALNTMIMSLLYKKHPAEMKLVLMDPYGVELGVYSQIANHFLATLPNESTIVSNSNKAVSTLNGLCKEMEARYDLLKKAYVRNIKEYNRKFIDRQLNPTIGHRFMPYIVVVIDEYGDFIEEKGQDFETPIVQLAQYARAVGIHMIISTKRPTNDIITGAIKANFPTRIAFRLPERIDSQVILDCDGAEELLGNGDMLFRAGKSIDCIRVQCALVDTPEVERICQFVSQQQGYISPFELPDPYFDDTEYGESHDVDMQHLDPLFEDAARLIVMTQEGSTSLIQRKFAIGYNRAGRLMDQLEKAGIVGAAHGSRPREVLIMDEMSLENLLSQWRA